MDDRQANIPSWDALNYVPIGVVVLREDFSVVHWNMCLEEWTGISSSEMLGTNVVARFPGFARPDVTGRIQTVFAGGPPVVLSSQLHQCIISRLDKETSFQEVMVMGAPANDGDGFLAVFAIQDVTDLATRIRGYWVINKRLEHEITERTRIDEERERLSSIIEATPDLVGFVDREGHVQYFNQAARRILGIPAQARLQDFHLGDFLSERSAKITFETALPETIRNGSWKGEVAWLSSDGQEIATAMVLQAHDAQDGQVEAVSAIAHDISDLRDAEQSLQRAERLASIGTLAAGIAHEINNPLGAMLLSAEYALQKLDNRTVVEESLEDILSHVERCAQIVRSVLRFSRNDYSKKTGHDLSNLLHRAKDLTRHQAQQSGVLVDLDTSVGACCMTINPLEMEQVFVNLIVNAVESSKGGGRVSVKLDLADDRARVVVEDQGVGMPAELRSRVFDPFFTTRLHSGGTGLGLSIVHGIVRDHGGSIEVWSEPEKGTRVTVMLPRNRKGQADAQDPRR